MLAKEKNKVKDELLTTAEVAELLGYSVSYINTLARKKWFPDGAIEESPGGHRRFRKSKVAKLFGNNYRKRRAR